MVSLSLFPLASTLALLAARGGHAAPSADTTDPSECATPSNGACGDEASGATCCPVDQYCQPWSPTSYECVDAPDQCDAPEVGVDFYGADMFRVVGITPGDCCDRCAATAGCNAYTFVASDYDGNAGCYLKTGTGERQQKSSAVSAVVTNPLPATCNTTMWARCGNAENGTVCCPGGAYCQPWDTGNYQCIVTPDQCTEQLTNVEFVGDDLNVTHGSGPGECCALCAETPGCAAYTYVNDETPEPQACHLKSSTAEKRQHPTAVSGLLNGN